MMFFLIKALPATSKVVPCKAGDQNVLFRNEIKQ